LRADLVTYSKYWVQGPVGYSGGAFPEVERWFGLIGQILPEFKVSRGRIRIIKGKLLHPNRFILKTGIKPLPLLPFIPMRLTPRSLFACILLTFLLVACGGSQNELLPESVTQQTVFTIGGDRPATLKLPMGYDFMGVLPVVIALHGHPGNSMGFDASWGLSERIDADNFALILPEGTRNPANRRFWNATGYCCDFFESGVDDVAYLSSLIEEAGEYIQVGHIFSVGHSNGGFMSYRLACEGFPGLTAIAPLAGSSFLDPTRCEEAPPVSVLHIHGTADPIVLYAGRERIRMNRDGYVGAEDVVARWAKRAGCDLSKAEELPAIDIDRANDGAETDRIRYREGCQDGITVELWKINEGSHIPGFTPNYAELLIDWLLNESRTEAS